MFNKIKASGCKILSLNSEKAECAAPKLIRSSFKIYPYIYNLQSRASQDS